MRRRSLTACSLILTALMLFASLSAFTSTNLPLADDQPQKAIISAYTAHARIDIYGNSGFLGSNSTTGICRGSGTASDPYIIEGWDIDASSSTGIEIQNSDLHFIIRYCYIHDGGTNNEGISLHSCVNGVLESNTCSNNLLGIGLYSGSGNTMSNNTCSNNNCGIYLYQSSGNIISNNDCSGNVKDGINLRESTGNTLINNDLGESGPASGDLAMYLAVAAIVISIVVVVMVILMRRKKRE